MTSAPKAGWRIVGASVSGAAHAATGATCQDAHGFTIAGPPGRHSTLVIAAADGAGSAPQSATGADIAIRSFLGSVMASLIGSPVETLAATTPCWLDDVRAALRGRAAADARPLADYACTFMGAVLGDDHAILLQIGDGIIAYRTRPENPWVPVVWPQTGEYRNTTYFITDDDAMERIAIRHVADSITQIAITTDGLTDLCLDQTLRLIHQPFFDSLLQTFDGAAVSEVAEVEAALSSFLQSPGVTSQSRDDKTLVLASRASAPMPPV